MGLVIKLLPFVAIAFFWYRAPAQATRMLKMFANGPNAVLTTMNIRNAADAISMDVRYGSSCPMDVSRYLQDSMSGRNRRPDLDGWGNPYVLEGCPQRPALRSCGPDATCDTDDDLVVEISVKGRES